jgi:hypothetical protein
MRALCLVNLLPRWAVHSKVTVVIGWVLRCSQKEKNEKLPGGVLSHPQKSKAGGGIPAYRNVNQKVSGELTPKESNPR